MGNMGMVLNAPAATSFSHLFSVLIEFYFYITAPWFLWMKLEGDSPKIKKALNQSVAKRKGEQIRLAEFETGTYTM